MKKEIKMRIVKRMAIVGLAAVAGVILFACKKAETPIPNTDIRIDVDADINDGNSINGKEVKTQINENNGSNVTITPEEAARGKTVENTRRTVNEYGVTIYGKPISEQEAINKGIANKWDIEDDKKNGWIRTYTEYYSDAYGGIIYLAINGKTGGKEYFNKDGISIGTGSKASANVDIEKILANVKMGNAMAEAIDKKYKK